MEKKLTAIAIANDLRARYSSMLVPMLDEKGETVLTVGNGKFAIPCVDANGEDSWVVVSISVPKGSRDGDPYDGYSEAETYNMNEKAKAEKKAAAEKLKAEKAAEREAKKAEREAKKKAEEAKAEQA